MKVEIWHNIIPKGIPQEKQNDWSKKISNRRFIINTVYVEFGDDLLEGTKAESHERIQE